MEVRFIGRVLPSTGKIHQNQEVASGGVLLHSQSYTL